MERPTKVVSTPGNDGGFAALPRAAEPEVPAVYLYVNDLADPGVLLSSEAADIEGICYEVDYRTTAEIIVLIVNTTLPLGIDLFAVETFEQNGIGKAGKDNGVLLVVSVDERAWRVEVGYGLEPILPDAKVGSWGLEILAPALNASDYYTGLYDLTLTIGQEIVDNYDPNAPPQEPRLWIVDYWYVAILVAVFVGSLLPTKGRGSIFLGLGGMWKRGGGGGGRSGGGGARGQY